MINHVVKKNKKNCWQALAAYAEWMVSEGYWAAAWSAAAGDFASFTTDMEISIACPI